MTTNIKYITNKAIKVAYTAALAGSNLPQTVLKSIMFGAAKDSEKIEPTSGSHLHTVSFNVENGKT